MAGPNKRRALANEGNNESGNDSESESYHGGEVINYNKLVCS